MSAGKKAVKAQQQLTTEKDQLLQELQASRQQQAAADAKAQQLAADLASAEQKWLELQFLCEKATAAAEDALEAHTLLKCREEGMDAELAAAATLNATAAAEDALEAHTLLKCREEGMDAELAAANAQLAQLNSQLAAAQQQAAAAADRAAEAEEQCKQADAEAQQACLAKKKLQEEKQQLAKELQQTKAAQAPQQARLQQLYGEMEVARRQLAEGKLRSSKLHEAIQQGEAAAAAAATAHAQLQTEKQQLQADKQQLRQQLEAAQKSNSRKSAKLTAAEAKLAEAEKMVEELEAAAAAAAEAASAATVVADSASKEQEKKQSPAAKAPKKQQQQQQQQQASAAKAQKKKQEAAEQEAVLLQQQLQALQAEHEQLQAELAAAKQQLAESVCTSSSVAVGSHTKQQVAVPPADPRLSDERARLIRQLDKARLEQQQHQARLQQLAERLAAAEAELAATAAAAAAAAATGAEADPQQKLQTCEQELASTQHQVQAGIAKLVQAVQGTISAQKDVADIRSRSHSSEEEGWSAAAQDAALPGLQAAQAALQQQQALVGQVSSELSPALVKIVKLEQQAMDGPLQAAGHQHQLQRTAARLAAQLRAAQASQLQQQAKLQQLTQQLEAMDQQQAAAGGAETLQPPPATAAAAEGERRPTAGMDVQDLLLKSAGDFSVHENPTADEEADISAQLRELHFELAEARERIEQIEDARQRADNAALAAYEYQQQLEEHAAALQEELDGCKAQHSQQQARMQKVTDELLRQVTRELAGVRHQLVDSQSKSVKLKVLCKEVFASAHTATGQQHKLSSELANMTQQLEAVESMQQVKLQQLTEELAGDEDSQQQR
ncbi:hypothetical protein OEZ86_012759 [Tetradesmus obliquus]|nr:hypothetical protein OEZ86_012759 [Tetradesmus obliquus]